MGDTFGNNKITLLFDKYSEESKKLFTSFKMANIKCNAISIDDDGFLPDDVLSPYGYYLGKFEGCERHFNQITVPEYWEIESTNSMGKVMDLGHERGHIFYIKPTNKRIVKTVDWMNEKGVVRSSDHYNKYGRLWGRTIFNAKGKKVNRAYFDANGREIIVENFVKGTIILNCGGEIRIFENKTQFVSSFFKDTGLDKTSIYFNSLSTPFFVSEDFARTGEIGGDVLFWNEPINDEIPGNMRFILENKASRADRIFVQKRTAYERLLELGADKEKIAPLGYIYPYEKTNSGSKEALICTNTENVEKLEEIAKALPKINFHVVAITEMSAKLLAIGKLENVLMYPAADREVIEELFDKCDLYLDINREGEILDAIYKAYLHNQLIFAFEETAHNREYVSTENIFKLENVDALVNRIKNIFKDKMAINEALKNQHDAGFEANIDDYAKM